MTKQYRVAWVDPPEGWMYGFPKKVDEAFHNMREDKTQWYIDNGYPKEKVHLLEYTRCGLEEIYEN